MENLTYEEAYKKAFSITLRIYNLYTRIIEYKLTGLDQKEEKQDDFNNILLLLEEFLEKEESIYDEIERKFDLNQLYDFCGYIVDENGGNDEKIDFENLPRASILLIPCRIINRINDRYRRNPLNAKIVLPDESDKLVTVTSENEYIAKDYGINLKEFQRDYLNTIKLEDAFYEDFDHFFAYKINNWLKNNLPKTKQEAKLYERVFNSLFMLTFTVYTDELKLIKKGFEYPTEVKEKASIIFDTLRNFTEERYNIIKSSSTIADLKDCIETFITKEEIDISNLNDPTAILEQLYFEAGLETLNKNEFNDILQTYKNLLIDIEKDDTKYFSEDAIIIIRKILKQIGIKNFNFDITANNKKGNYHDERNKEQKVINSDKENKNKKKREAKILKQFIPVVPKRILPKNEKKPTNHNEKAKIKQQRWFKN